MEYMIVELGLSLVVFATNLAFSYPVNNLSNIFSLGILAFLVMSVQLPSIVELLLTLLALVVLGRFFSSPLAEDASDSVGEVRLGASLITLVYFLLELMDLQLCLLGFMFCL